MNRIETLELRQLMTAATGAFESIDGTANNPFHPTWGSTGVDLLRESKPAYADGILQPAGTNRPSARVISNAIAAADPKGTLSRRHLSAFAYVWGQFVDHDLDLTPSATPAEPFNIDVPADDAFFGPDPIFLNRSLSDPATGTSKSNPRQQVNVITSWIDGSVIYGSDADRAAALRSGVGGTLKTGPDGNSLPLNTDGLPNANDAHILPDNQLFLAGDVRANENIELSAVQTLFMREHNRLAASFAAQNPNWTDEQIFQDARKVVIGELQAITYNQFLPALLGNGAIDRYRGYDPSVNPGISTEFSTAAFRLGHSMLGDDVEFLDNNGSEVRDPLPLSQAFFNPTVVKETGIGPILKYLASDPSQEIDNQVVDGVRNFLFGPPGAGGFDLASLNIQRGRDHGLADYNSVRAAYGLPRVTSFSQITSNQQVASTLQSLYGSVDNIDLWVGGLAEDHVRGSSLGATFRTIVADQFERLRDGDRFWYERQFSGRQLDQIRGTTLASIVKRNSEVSNVQDNVFVFEVNLNGQVYNDVNRNRRQDWFERVFSGWTVQLVSDADGSVLETTTTGRDGRYSFSRPELGAYRINVAEPAGWTQTTLDPSVVNATRGLTVNGLNFGYVRTRASNAIAADAAIGDSTSLTDQVADPIDELLVE